MRLSSLITAITGIAVAAGTTFLAKDYLEISSETAKSARDSLTVPVVVAGANIAFGQTIESHNLTTIDWPKDAVPAGAFEGFDNLLPEGEENPRRARRAFSKGDLILASKVSAFGEKVTITQALEASRRAIAIQVDATTSVGGFVTPGDSVDVVLTRGRDADLRTVTILQNVKVLGVDQMADENEDAPTVARTVTIDVSPEEAQRVSLAQKAGTLSLTLRSVEASTDKPIEAIRLRDILQEKSPVPEEQKRPTILVRRGVTLVEDTLR